MATPGCAAAGSACPGTPGLAQTLSSLPPSRWWRRVPPPGGCQLCWSLRRSGGPGGGTPSRIPRPAEVKCPCQHAGDSAEHHANVAQQLACRLGFAMGLVDALVFADLDGPALPPPSGMHPSPQPDTWRSNCQPRHLRSLAYAGYCLAAARPTAADIRLFTYQCSTRAGHFPAPHKRQPPPHAGRRDCVGLALSVQCATRSLITPL